MTQPGNHGEALATIRNWDDLPAAFRAAVQSLNVSHEVLDTVSGLQPGYVSKLLAPVPVKGFGKMAFDLLLGATGKMLVMVDDPAALERVQTRLTKRDETRMPKFKNLSMHSTVVHFKISLRKMRQKGRKGGENSRKNMTERQARKLARKAARARWHKPNLIEVIPPQADHAADTSPAAAQRAAE